ncbi:MAG TPA: hotdog fold thioesterase [Steroidobacteraceae bacterium]|nr:hotdog fold thioesterase [Steroidobacteraceae bacterium]
MSIWYRPFTLEDLERQSGNTMNRHLDIRFSEIGPDYIRASMPVDERTRQPYGLLHGGASVVLAETLGSVGANCCVDPERFYCVGQEINANHLRSVRSGRVTGTARPVHIGGRSQVWDIRIEDGDGRLTCVSRITMAVIARPSPATGGTAGSAT